MSVVSVGFSVAALGLQKVAQSDKCRAVLRFGLELVLPSKVVDIVMDKLKEKEILDEIKKLEGKIDKMIFEPLHSAAQMLKDATIAYNHENYPTAVEYFKEVRQTAVKAFNLSSDIQAWVKTTQLKIAGYYMSQSYVENRGIVLFNDLPGTKQREIASTIQGYIDDLLEKVDAVKKEIIEKSSKNLRKKKGKKDAIEKMKEINDEVDGVLIKSYPLLSQGLRWTDPFRSINMATDSYSFDIFPKYVPEGVEDSVDVVVSTRPSIIVSLHRRLDFSHKSTDLIEAQILTWTLNGNSHQEIFNASDYNCEPISVNIPKEELAKVFRGGQEASTENRNQSIRRITLAAGSSPQNFASTTSNSDLNMNKIASSVSLPEEDAEEDLCGQCNKEIKGRQIVALGKVYHPECFTCTNCSEVLVGDFRKYLGKPYCEEHYRNLPHWPRCFQCSAPIVRGARKARAKGNIYHAQCLRCAVCDKQLDADTGYYQLEPGKLVCEDDIEPNRKCTNPKTKMKCDECDKDIEGTYFQYNGRNLCSKDYEKCRKKCSICHANISGSYYTSSDGKIICADDYKKQQGGSLACQKCGKDVSAGEIVRAVGTLFHPECFSCCVCNKDLTGKNTPFMSDDAKNIYCREDYHMKFSPKCYGCKQPIAPKPGEKSAARLKALDKDWHPECFKCEDCSAKLGGSDGKKCYPLKEAPLCLECHKKRL